VYGPIEDVEALLATQPITIIDNTALHIDQYLIGHRTYSAEELQHNHLRILSQPPALAQAADWLQRSLAGYELCETADTAASVRRVVQDGIAYQLAVGGKHAAELYGGTIAAGPLNSQQNTTEFILFKR
jgi:prephenate dehydratase